MLSYRLESGNDMADRFGSQYGRELMTLATCIASKECCYDSSPFLSARNFKDPHGWHEFAGLKSTCEDSDNHLPLFRRNELNIKKKEKGEEKIETTALRHLNSSVGSEVKNEIKRVARSMYFSTPKPSALDCEHVVHIRRSDVQPNNRNSKRYVTDTTWINVLDAIHAKNPEARVCILSDGTTEELQKFEVYGDVYNNADEKQSFHTMVEAPNLYISKGSQFSAAAGYLNTNNVITIADKNKS